MWLLAFNLNLFLLTLVIAGACLWPRTSPAARHALWLLVLLKLLSPPFLLRPWSLPVPHGVFNERVTQISEEPLPSGSRSEAGPNVRCESPAPDFRPVERSDHPVSAPASDAGSSDPMRSELESEWRDRAITAVAVVWFGGGLVVTAVQFRRLGRFRGMLTYDRQAPSPLTSQVEELASLLGVRCPRLVVLPGLSSPLICAAGQTCLLWPEGLEAELSPEGCRAVLAHELAHLARRDHWVAWLIFAAGCVWWWHPFFYLVRRRLHREAELACDARVLAALPDSRRVYAEALLDVCQRQTQSMALAPALGVASRRRELERRLVMILRANVPSRLSLRLLLGIALLGLIVLPGWSLGQKKSPIKGTPAEEGRRLDELERKVQVILKDLEAQRKPAPAVSVDYGFPVLLAKQDEPEKLYVDLDGVGVLAQPSDRDKKLQEIEAKLQALLKEVQSLRNEKPGMQSQGIVLNEINLDRIVDLVVVNDTRRKPVELTLSRTTYHLPAAKAEALGKLLQHHVKASVMETKAEGDTLTVTTTPEVQHGIRQFIALMEGKTQRVEPGQQQRQ